MTEDPSVKDKASESAQAGKQAASDLASTAAGKAQDIAHEAKGQARNLVGEARDQLRSQAGVQQRTAVGNLRSLGDELRSMANNSQQAGQQNGLATDVVSQAADRAHGVADWLDRREPDDLLDEVRRFARRRPGAFLLGALAAGVIAGRLTRGVVAEHSDDDEDASTGPSQSYGADAPAAAGAPYAGSTENAAAAHPGTAVPGPGGAGAPPSGAPDTYFDTGADTPYTGDPGTYQGGPGRHEDTATYLSGGSR